MSIKMPHKNLCAECKVKRVPKRGILAINCVVEKDSEWFCGYPCLLDFFNKIDGNDVSATTKLLQAFGMEPQKTLSTDKPVSLMLKDEEE